MTEEKKHADSDPPPVVDVVVHEYDGIQEYDNRLPNWWLWTLFGTIVFGFLYWVGYQTFNALDNPRTAYDKEVAIARAKEIERMKNAGPVTAELLLTMSKDSATVENGKKIFTTNCVACHRADGGGNIGPNLTDKYWLHGGKPDQIFKTVTEGVPAKGMLAWGPMLGPDKVQSVTAYVLTLHDTEVPNGKAPQGEPE
jgi:cytochrome c oxidase cbb3-type subunit 3